jgi:hypothetical protein
MNVRYVNYYINSQGGYLNCDKHIITSNKFVELDENLNVINEKLFDLNFDNRLYIGVEDVRIFNDTNSNELLFIGTGLHRDNTIGIVKGDYNINQNILNYTELKQTFKFSDCEKNWVFTEYKNKTHIIYSWYPLNICEIDENTNLLKEVDKKTMPHIFSYVRGSTCGFKYSTNVEVINSGNISININQTEFWFVVHIVSYEQPRHYYHMLVVFDENMNLLRYSAPFKFEDNPIEYCLSIVVEDERVLINYSSWDRTTRIGVYDKKYIDSITKYN